MSKWGGFIDDIDAFDSTFFRITPQEAETLDPQERLFLEVCWETIEDAGYTPNTLVTSRGDNKRNDVGVYVGVMHKDYTQIESEVVTKDNVFPLSLNYALIANRVSYFVISMDQVLQLIRCALLLLFLFILPLKASDAESVRSPWQGE
jgi:polyketide synthase PksL